MSSPTGRRQRGSCQLQGEWREGGGEQCYFLIVLQQLCSKAQKQSRGKVPRNRICKFSQSEGFFFSTLRRPLNEMHFACLFKHYILNWFMMRLLYMVGYNLTLLRSVCQGESGLRKPSRVKQVCIHMHQETLFQVLNEMGLRHASIQPGWGTLWLILSCPSQPLLLSSFTEDLLPPGFPNIDMGPQLKVVERTRTATMLCAASGNPDPEITWYKDFLPIDPSASNGRIKQLRSGKGSWKSSLT